MYFEGPKKCPFLEDEESKWAKIPYCVMVYNELTLLTLDKLCYKNFTECSAYKKAIEEAKKYRPTE